MDTWVFMRIEYTRFVIACSAATIVALLGCSPLRDRETASGSASVGVEGGDFMEASDDGTPDPSGPGGIGTVGTSQADTSGSEAGSTSTLGGLGDASDADAPSNGFDALYESVISPRCIEDCHVPNTGVSNGGLHFVDPSEAYEALIGVPATIGGSSSHGCEGAIRVIPGDPATSLLWQKVQPGLPVCGFKMPESCFGDECGLAQDEANLVFDWIAAGAAR